MAGKHVPLSNGSPAVDKSNQAYRRKRSRINRRKIILPNVIKCKCCAEKFINPSWFSLHLVEGRDCLGYYMKEGLTEQIEGINIVPDTIHLSFQRGIKGCELVGVSLAGQLRKIHTFPSLNSGKQFIQENFGVDFSLFVAYM